MTLKLKSQPAFLTRAMVLKKFKSMEDFAKAAKMTRQNIYLIVDNPKYGYRKNSKKTVDKLLKLLRGKV
jgi:hypothetical protein